MARMPRVVVVDDEPELRKILSDYLGRHGFSVHVVADGDALDASLATEEADLLILDIAMPDEDGLSITRRIRGRSPVSISAAGRCRRPYAEQAEIMAGPCPA